MIVRLAQSVSSATLSHSWQLRGASLCATQRSIAYLQERFTRGTPNCCGGSGADLKGKVCPACRRRLTLGSDRQEVTGFIFEIWIVCACSLTFPLTRTLSPLYFFAFLGFEILSVVLLLVF
jgi:hypothetical protein